MCNSKTLFLYFQDKLIFYFINKTFNGKRAKSICNPVELQNKYR